MMQPVMILPIDMTIAPIGRITSYRSRSVAINTNIIQGGFYKLNCLYYFVNQMIIRIFKHTKS